MHPAPSPANRLADCIAQAGGWLSFEKFMTAALYDPDFGYYSKRIRNVGGRGDFTTTPEQSPLLGQAVAGWARRQRRRMPRSRRWHLVEIGGGSGALAKAILENLGIISRLGLTYHLVEISGPLRERQREILRGFPVCWHPTAAEALAAAEGTALLFSNELVDAFPCRRMRWIDGGWHELGIVVAAGKIAESVRKLSAEECQSLRSSLIAESENPEIRAGEVHASYRTEMEKMARGLTCGVVLTIDYGDHFPQLYHRQVGGTVRGYVHHLRRDGAELYECPGQQDLTADVNFTDLENWGTAFGWLNESYETQREFIGRELGIKSPRTTLEARLLDPIGAGGAFKVLQQSHGLGK